METHGNGAEHELFDCGRRRERLSEATFGEYFAMKARAAPAATANEL